MITIKQLTATQVAEKMDELIRLLQNVVDDGASIGFLPPLGEEEARLYWQQCAGDVEQGGRLFFVALEGDQLAGSAQLGLESRRNGDHRAEVQKLMVHTRFRRRGIARQLMTAVEEAARAAQRTLLVLDTRRYDPSEQLYQSMDYAVAGIIPHYARSANGELHDTVFYYRLL